MMSDRNDERIFAVGDIHGCLDHLQQLIRMLPIRKEKDLLVFIGDYIDRGFDSQGVVEYVRHLRENLCETICLLGNHEQMFLDYLKGQNEEMFLYNGGLETLVSYGLHGRKKVSTDDLPPGHLAFFQDLQPYYENDDFILVHAGLRPGIPLSDQSLDDLLWLRFEFIKSDYDFGKTVIFGHTPLSKTLPFYGTKKVGIDTGAVYGGRLTCLELPEMRLYQV